MEAFKITKWDKLGLRIGQIAVAIIIMLNLYYMIDYLVVYERTGDFDFLIRFLILGTGTSICFLIIIWQWRRNRRIRAFLEAQKE